MGSVILISLTNKIPESDIKVKAEGSEKQRTVSFTSYFSNASEQKGWDPVSTQSYHFLSVCTGLQTSIVS